MKQYYVYTDHQLTESADKAGWPSLTRDRLTKVVEYYDGANFLKGNRHVFLGDRVTGTYMFTINLDRGTTFVDRKLRYADDPRVKYIQGHIDGYAVGQEDGYDVGLAEGKEESRLDYDRGYQNGLADGGSVVRTLATEEAYSRGYDDGMAWASSRAKAEFAIAIQEAINKVLPL